MRKPLNKKEKIRNHLHNIKEHTDMLVEDTPKITALKSKSGGDEINGNDILQKDQSPREKDMAGKETEGTEDDASTIMATTENVSTKSIRSLTFTDRIKLYH